MFSKKTLFIAIVAIGGGTLFSLVMNPYRIFSFPMSLNCSLHYNRPLRKAELLERAQGIQALILGGESSKVFLSQELEEIFGFKTFHGGLADTPPATHYVLAETGLGSQRTLTDMFYFVRFDEFLQHPFFPEDILVLGNQRLRERLPMATTPTAERIAQTDRLSQFLSPKHFLASFPQVLQCLGVSLGAPFSLQGVEKLETAVKARGENPSFSHFSQPDIRVDDRLIKKIKVSVQDLKKRALGRLGGHLETKAFYQQLVAAAESRGVRLHIILMPFHPMVKSEILATSQGTFGKDFDESLFGWIQYIKKFHRPPHVWVHDQSNPDRLFAPTSLFWRDGVTLSPRGAAHLLTDLHREINLKKEPAP